MPSVPPPFGASDIRGCPFHVALTPHRRHADLQGVICSRCAFHLGDSDGVFTLDWGKKWHSLIPHSTFDVMTGAAHFLQDSHGEEIVKAFLGRVSAE